MSEERGALSSEKVSLLARPEEQEEQEEQEMVSSAHLEPSTLPWPGDREPRQQEAQEEMGSSTKRRSKSRWRESLPEGERWSNEEEEEEEEEEEVQHQGNGGDGSLADDEEEEEEEEQEEQEELWFSKEAGRGFTPEVTIVQPSCKLQPEEQQPFIHRTWLEAGPGGPEAGPAPPLYPQYPEDDDKYYLCEGVRAARIQVLLATAAAGLLFPLLVWAGYALLPFDLPPLQSAPLRVVYALRCAFFAGIPILLGMLVLGLARLLHGSVGAPQQAEREPRDVAVHRHFVSESLSLFLLFFLQLAVTASYVGQDLLKLVPLLTICFSLGRLIYWLCLFLGGSSARALGFGLSFHPLLVLLGVNLYYVCSSLGPGAVFDVAPPPTPAPAGRSWWG